IPVIERRREGLDGGPGIPRLIEPADQLLGFAAEHAAADQIETAGGLVEPDLLKRHRPRLRRVMAPADGQKALGRAVARMKSLRPAGQVATPGLSADAVVELEGEIRAAQQFRHRTGGSAGGLELPA